MKKIIIGLLATCLLVSIVGCSKREEQSSSSIISEPSQTMPPAVPHEPSSLPEIPPSSSSSSSSSQSDVNTAATLDKKELDWGPGVQVDDRKRPIGSIDYQNKFGKYDAYFIESDSNNVYLTFDEGYDNGYTEKILDVLKEKQVPAVFFVTMGFVKQRPDLIQRMIDEGHTLGNHSSKHPRYPSIDIETAQNDLLEMHDYILTNFGYEMKLFRFPAGAFNEQTLAMVKNNGYKSIFWSFAYKDWLVDEQPTHEQALEKIVGRAHPGAIFLLHSVSKTNAEVLGQAIDEIQEQGYVFSDYPTA